MCVEFIHVFPFYTHMAVIYVPKPPFMTLLRFVLDNNFFVFQGSHFQQIFGCPMGSPVSAILANLVMEHVEEKALSLAP